MHTPVIRIPKSAESHSDFQWLAAVYGFGTLTIVIEEEKALAAQPRVPCLRRRLKDKEDKASEAEELGKAAKLKTGKEKNADVETHAAAQQRDLSAIIFLRSDWSFRFDPEHTFGETDVSMAEVELLTLSNVRHKDFVSSHEYAAPLKLKWSHQGLMKHLCLPKSEAHQAVQVFTQHDGSMGYTVGDGDRDAATLLPDEELLIVINKMWDLKTREAAIEFCQETFPSHKEQQIALLFSFAMNNLLLKTMRNQIVFESN